MGDIIKATEEYLKFYNFTEKHSPKTLHEIAFGYNKSQFLQSPYWGKVVFAIRLSDVGDNSGIDTFKR